MKEPEMEILGQFILRAIEKRADDAALKALHEEVKTFCRKFPVPGIAA